VTDGVFTVQSFALEMMLDGINWTDVTQDVLAESGIAVDYGISGHRPQDRVARIGTMKFKLNNSERNSASTLGYYTAGGPNCRSGFELNIPVRVKINAGVKYGEAKYGAFQYGGALVKLTGKLKRADPKPGIKRERFTDCSVADFMYEVERHKLQRMPIQTSRRSDLAVQDVLDNMPVAPEDTELNTGQEIFAYMGDTMADENSTALAAIQKICMSEFGYVYLRGDGTFVFEDRHHRVNTDPLFTVDYELTDMGAQRDIENVFNLVRIMVYPREVGVANETLFTLQRTIEIAAGASITFVARYTDPTTRQARISGMTMVTPVIDTDYKFGSSEGGGANDLNADLTVVVTFGANSAEVVLTSTAVVTGYVNLFQLRGLAIRLYESVEVSAEDTDSQIDFDVRPLDLTLAFQTSPLVGQDFANIVRAAYSYPQYFVPKISTVGMDQDRAKMMLHLEPGDRITLTEAVLGLDAVDYFIHGVHLVLTPPNIIAASWSIKIASTEQSWLLGLAGFSELGETLFLGA
jgi:hypothetical protein